VRELWVSGVLEWRLRECDGFLLMLRHQTGKGGSCVWSPASGGILDGGNRAYDVDVAMPGKGVRARCMACVVWKL
jgi:hypothetical protein